MYNFDSPEWEGKSQEFSDQLARLSELIKTERYLVGLLKDYRVRSDGVTLCTGVYDGKPIGEVRLDQRDDWLPIVDLVLTQRIAQTRIDMGLLLSQIAN